MILTDRAVDVTDDSLYVTFMGSDFVEEGRKAGRWLLDNTKDRAGDINIVELQGTVGSAPANDRKKGFQEIIAADPRYKIIRSQTGDFTRAKGKEVMEAFLKAEGQRINVLYAHNDDMAIGAIQAIEEAGIKPGKDILIISVDAVKGAFEAMIAGKLNVTVECNPLLGPQLMAAVKDVVAGKPVPKRIVTEESDFPDGNGEGRFPDAQVLSRGARGPEHMTAQASSVCAASGPHQPQLSGCAGARGRGPVPARRRSARADGAERRGEIDAHQSAHGRVRARGGHHRARWARDSARARPCDAQRLGISTVYQEVNLCPNLSVAENIFAGRYPRHAVVARRRHRLECRAMREARARASHLAAGHRCDAPALELSGGRFSRWWRSRARRTCRRAC